MFGGFIGGYGNAILKMAAFRKILAAIKMDMIIFGKSGWLTRLFTFKLLGRSRNRQILRALGIDVTKLPDLFRIFKVRLGTLFGRLGVYLA